MAGRSQKDFLRKYNFYVKKTDVKIWIFGKLNSKMQVKMPVSFHLTPEGMAIYYQGNKQEMLWQYSAEETDEQSVRGVCTEGSRKTKD